MLQTFKTPIRFDTKVQLKFKQKYHYWHVAKLSYQYIEFHFLSSWQFLQSAVTNQELLPAVVKRDDIKFISLSIYSVHPHLWNLRKYQDNCFDERQRLPSKSSKQDRYFTGWNLLARDTDFPRCVLICWDSTVGRNKNVPREIGRNINLNFTGGRIDRSAGNRGRRPRGKEFFQFCKSVINKGGRATHSAKSFPSWISMGSRRSRVGDVFKSEYRDL